MTDTEFLAREYRFRNIHERYILVADHPNFFGERVIVRQCESFAPACREAREMPERNPAVYYCERRGWTKML